MRTLKVFSAGLAALGAFMISAPLAEAAPDPGAQLPTDSTTAALETPRGYAVQVQRPEQAMVTADLSVSAGGCMVGGISGAFGGAVTGLIDCW
ncbi:hypothetical protein [uncultured Propionibacterium sp.]|uniref:hypothetical protein n=1 Tax=uncultured Propionibacterium sp. TaxID=218066 RepID=UPI00292E5A97|nr:hypothetical protein [uncultured Propionibacterium sp.]